MTEAVEQLKSQAITLSAAERADLAHFLLTSLEADEEGAEDAWRKEIARRVREIRNGQAVGRPLEDVLVEIWDSIAAEAENLPITDAQKQDLQRRLAAYEANRHAGSTWEEVKARLQERG